MRRSPVRRRSCCPLARTCTRCPNGSRRGARRRCRRRPRSWLPTTCRPRGQSGGPGSGGGSVPSFMRAVVGILGAAAASAAANKQRRQRRAHHRHGYGYTTRMASAQSWFIAASPASFGCSLSDVEFVLRVRHEVRVQVGADLQLVRARQLVDDGVVHGQGVVRAVVRERDVREDRLASGRLDHVDHRLQVGLERRRAGSGRPPRRWSRSRSRRSGSRGSAPASSARRARPSVDFSPPMPPLIIAGMYAFAVAVLIAAAKLG